MLRVATAAALVLAGVPRVAAAEPDARVEDPRALVEAAIAAHGGEMWLSPGTLVLTGHAEFYSPDAAEPRSRADDYRMWRVMDPDRTEAHGPDGKVRITARAGDRVLFDVGYDGETTWNERGVVPKAEADAFWASNFGFGIIRSALRQGFRIERAPPREIGGALVDMVRIVDPGGAATLFGIDRESRFIRYMGFRTPRGWHERHYGDFVRLTDPDWVQARTVTLFYDGVRANTVYWRTAEVGGAIPDEVFTPPGG